MKISDETKFHMAVLVLARSAKTPEEAWDLIEEVLAAAPKPEPVTKVAPQFRVPPVTAEARQSSGNPGELTPEGREALVRWIESVHEQLGALPPTNWRDYISEPQPEPTSDDWLNAQRKWGVPTPYHILAAVAREAYRLAREGR